MHLDFVGDSMSALFFVTTPASGVCVFVSVSLRLCVCVSASVHTLCVIYLYFRPTTPRDILNFKSTSQRVSRDIFNSDLQLHVIHWNLQPHVIYLTSDLLRKGSHVIHLTSDLQPHVMHGQHCIVFILHAFAAAGSVLSSSGCMIEQSKMSELVRASTASILIAKPRHQTKTWKPPMWETCNSYLWRHLSFFSLTHCPRQVRRASAQTTSNSKRRANDETSDM